MLAYRPATQIGPTTLVGKEEEVILKIAVIHWLEGERGEREREREREYISFLSQNIIIAIT